MLVFIEMKCCLVIAQNLGSLHDKEVKQLAATQVSSQLNRQLLSKLRDEMMKLGGRSVS